MIRDLDLLFGAKPAGHHTLGSGSNKLCSGGVTIGQVFDFEGINKEVVWFFSEDTVDFDVWPVESEFGSIFEGQVVHSQINGVYFVGIHADFDIELGLKGWS